MKSSVYAIRASLSNVYLIVSGNGCCLIDAGSPGEGEKIVRQLRRLTRSELRLIYITHAHFDHYGGAYTISRTTGAPIAIHQADAHDMAHGRTVLGSARGRGRVVGLAYLLFRRLIRVKPAKPDVLLEGGDSLSGFGLEATVIHTPGHTMGSSSLYLESSALFAGDLLLSTGRPHLQSAFAHDWPSVDESLARVQALAPAVVYPGHGRRTISAEALQELGPR